MVEISGLVLNMKNLITAVIIFCVTFCLYTLMSYGGIREADGEIVFRVGESLARHFSFEIAEELPWKGLGLATGRDGKKYAVFGPVQSILSAPLIELGQVINRTQWYDQMRYLPASQIVGHGLKDFMLHRKPEPVAQHALRFIVSFLNIIAGALGVTVFWLIARRMAQNPESAGAVTVLYGLGTLIWPYSGTFFSEPLTILWLLASFYFLVGNDACFQQEPTAPSACGFMGAGLCLGIAIATHISAILFTPFFWGYGIYLTYRHNGRRFRPAAPYLWFLFGLGIVIAALGYYNFYRFGSLLETGRSADLLAAKVHRYGRFVMPWTGLYGLLFSPGKGLFLFVPATILGIYTWPFFHKRYPFLSCTLAGAFLFRVVFIAARSDWPGGLSLGPRYLLLSIPFLLLPAIFWLDEQIRSRNIRRLSGIMGFILLCMAQQVYFCLGELYSYFHLMKWFFLRRGIDISVNNQLYFQWELSPLWNLLKGKRGPFLLQQISLSNFALWAGITSFLAVISIIGTLSLAKTIRQPKINPEENHKTIS